MLNLNKTVVVKIDPKFSANDWQLYTASMPCKRAANALNSNLKKLVNTKGSTVDSVRSGMSSTMAKYSKFGAYDSEPIWFLDHILNQVYKE
jgi:hypothetical protein